MRIITAKCGFAEVESSEGTDLGCDSER